MRDPNAGSFCPPYNYTFPFLRGEGFDKKPDKQ